MNKDMARKLVAQVSSTRKGSLSFTMQDFITSLSFKKNLLDPETVKDFVESAVKEGLLVKKDENYLPNFSTSGVIVPLDFSVNKEELFQVSTDRPLVDRLLEAVSASGKMTKIEAISRAREVLQPMKYIYQRSAIQ